MWVGTRVGRVFVSKNANAPSPTSVAFTRIDTPSQPSRFVSAGSRSTREPEPRVRLVLGYDAYTPTAPPATCSTSSPPGRRARPPGSNIASTSAISRSPPWPYDRGPVTCTSSTDLRRRRAPARQRALGARRGRSAARRGVRPQAAVGRFRECESNQSEPDCVRWPIQCRSNYYNQDLNYVWVTDTSTTPPTVAPLDRDGTQRSRRSCKNFKLARDGGHPMAIGLLSSPIGSAVKSTVRLTPSSFKMPKV